MKRGRCLAGDQPQLVEWNVEIGTLELQFVDERGEPVRGLGLCVLDDPLDLKAEPNATDSAGMLRGDDGGPRGVARRRARALIGLAAPLTELVGIAASSDTAPVDRPLSTNLEDEEAQPYFVWDVPITYGELRRRLQAPDLDERALWMGRVMREARYQDVWKLMRLRDVLSLLPRIEKHLGKTREFWKWLIDGWRRDGLV